MKTNYKMSNEELIKEVQVVWKDVTTCVDIFINTRDELKSFNIILNKFGKKYWIALSVMAQKELQKWIDEAKILEKDKH